MLGAKTKVSQERSGTVEMEESERVLNQNVADMLMSRF